MTQPQPFPLPLPFRARPTASAASDLAVALLGPSMAMSLLWSQLRRIAAHVRTVLLTGEPDCGQEAVARVLLDLSPHPRRTFFSLSAAEAEARLLRPAGLSSLAADLFLFVPDVHRYSPEAQEALLRLMRMRRSRPFTVVAVTDEDLSSLVATAGFSPELADALASVRVGLPCLRDRTEDLPMLVAHLFESRRPDKSRPAPRPNEAFLRAAMQHPWPGNFGELVAVVSSLCATDRGGELGAEDLERALRSHSAPHTSSSAAHRLVSLDTVVQEHICTVLRACRGNKLRAAEILGISRSTLYRMLDTAAVRKSSLSMAS